MIINSLIRYFSGSVTFQAENGFIERLINLCAENSLPLWDFHRTDTGFQAVCRAGDYKRIKGFSRKVNVDVSLVGKKGFFFQAGKYRRRWGLFAGLAASLLFLFFSQCFVWEIEVVGNERISSQLILKELEALGVRRFAFIPGIDFRMKKQEALLAMPQLSWLVINQNGCRLQVEVTERQTPPLIQESDPCDIIAARTGQIKYMDVYNGEKQVEVNYTVKEGDVIVRGVYQLESGQIIVSHAAAKVIAEVQFDKSLSLDMEQLSKEYTGETKTRFCLDLFSLRLPLYLASRMPGSWDAAGQTHHLTIGKQELPIGLYTVTYRFYEKKSDAISLEEARQVLKDSFDQYEAQLKGTVILERQTSETLQNGVLTRTVRYRAEQDIARESPVNP